MKVIVYRYFFVTLTSKDVFNHISEEKTMASKRLLKQRINLICEELFSECVAASLYGQMRNNYIRRVSHPEPGITAKAYYKDLKEKFSAQASELLDQLTNF